MRPVPVIHLLLGGSLILLASAEGNGADAILVGGGPDVHASQGQIELNVKWAQGVLKRQGMNVTTYFTDGQETGPDVHYVVATEEPPTPLEAMARVFGDRVLENRRYRENDVPDLAGSTRREELEPQLRDLFERATDDDLLMVYNGHGSQSVATPDQVTMSLWDDTSMSAGELHALLKPRSGTFRFVFTQCYSGGFHRLAYENPAQGMALSEAPRCGFTAESPYRLAEGCSASIDTDDYRDYSTYFFAALSGYERSGEIIGRSADVDGDGITSLREAHLFTLEQAFSTDLSRSTSEDYLTQWQPWFLRWLPAPKSLPNNDYARLYRDIAKRYDITLDDAALRTIRSKLKETENQISELAGDHALLAEDILQLQYELQSYLSTRWPALLGPYTGAYQSMASSGELLRVSSSIENLPAYRKLITAQERHDAMALERLALERLATQYQKLIHLRHLAHLQRQLSIYGSDREQADYQSLLACEDVPLTR
ncbi:MAG: hypothetical protein HKN42_18655 [Granulosicoccus sp.]|nr:hypothetical protein [Granulosicoccus sp.]